MIGFDEFKTTYQKENVEEYSNSPLSFPVVSVLVQTYNHAKFIGECLNGILRQKTTFPFEIILGEDFSDDETREICIHFADSHPEKIKLVLHHPANKILISGHPTGNFNVGYNYFISRGKYLAFCEGDDIWTDELKLQKQVEFLQNNKDYSFTYHAFKEIDQFGKVISQKLQLDQPKWDLTKESLQRLEYHPLLSTIVFRRNFEKLPPEIFKVVNMDSFFISFLGLYGKGKFQDGIKDNLYRRHSEGIWSSKNAISRLRSKENTFVQIRAFYNRIEKPELSQYFQKKRKIIRKMLLLQLIRTRRFADLVLFIRNSFSRSS